MATNFIKENNILKITTDGGTTFKYAHAAWCSIRFEGGYLVLTDHMANNVNEYRELIADVEVDSVAIADTEAAIVTAFSDKIG